MKILNTSTQPLHMFAGANHMHLSGVEFLIVRQLVMDIVASNRVINVYDEEGLVCRNAGKLGQVMDYVGRSAQTRLDVPTTKHDRNLTRREVIAWYQLVHGNGAAVISDMRNTERCHKWAQKAQALTAYF